MQTRISRLRSASRRTALLAAGLVACATALAQNASPVLHLVVPFAAGSYTDNVARIIAPGLGQHLGQTVVVENRAGANGIIGADYVAKAAPDGLTLLVGGASVNTVNPNIYKSLPYDPVHDLLPVARIGLLPFVLVTNNAVPAATVPELVAYAKKNPGKLAYGTPNATTLVGMETFKRDAGVDITSVPYKSSPQAVADLVGGHIQVLIADFATAMPQVQSGKVKLLAVTMRKRSALLPGVAAISETVKDFDISAWTGLLLPGKASPATGQRIYEALQATLATPEVREHFKTIGFDVQPLGPAEFGPFVRSEIATWSRLVKQAGIQPE
jgi:tripartite-type tricarboxylate transporter receptor subunit TctC